MVNFGQHQPLSAFSTRRNIFTQALRSTNVQPSTLSTCRRLATATGTTYIAAPYLC